MPEPAWESVQIARHTARPTARDHADAIFDYFFELRGDRSGKDDPAIITALANLEGRRLAVAAQEKGRGARGRERCSFGMTQPHGFRKTHRLFALAEKLRLPLVCMVDTPGASPGMEAEETGQAWAISRSLAMLVSLRVPVLVLLIGEGGSGGALALGVGDTVLALENATLSVISPEGCASILWRDTARAPQAAAMLCMTPPELSRLELTDALVLEPGGGAHADPAGAAANLRKAIVEHLDVLAAIPPAALLERRRRRYRNARLFLAGEGAARELEACIP
jgi:acetyl-CoA carboxylase carboxyl transferase alpha subunit